MSAVSLPCAVCGCTLPDALFLEAGDNQPYAGTAFQTDGHYGSTVFDPMNGDALELNICDPCLVRAALSGRVLLKTWRNTKKWKPKAKDADRAAKAIAMEAAKPTRREAGSARKGDSAGRKASPNPNQDHSA